MRVKKELLNIRNASKLVKDDNYYRCCHTAYYSKDMLLQYDLIETICRKHGDYELLKLLYLNPELKNGHNITIIPDSIKFDNVEDLIHVCQSLFNLWNLQMFDLSSIENENNNCMINGNKFLSYRHIHYDFNIWSQLLIHLSDENIKKDVQSILKFQNMIYGSLLENKTVNGKSKFFNNILTPLHNFYVTFKKEHKKNSTPVVEFNFDI